MHSEPISAEQAAPEFDFSHLMRTDAVAVAAYLRRHRKASDEMYLEALRQLDPPLELPEEMLTELTRELTPGLSRRGRPKAGAPTREEIAEALTRISRDDVPPVFLRRLSQRLRRGRSYTEEKRAKPFDKHAHGAERMMLIRGLYRDFYALLGHAKAEIHHPILGRLSVPASGTRREKALRMTWTLMHDAGFDPPDVITMRNLVGKIRRHNRD